MLPCRGATPFIHTHLYQNIISIHLPGLHVLIGSTFDIRFNRCEKKFAGDGGGPTDRSSYSHGSSRRADWKQNTETSRFIIETVRPSRYISG